MQRIVRFATRFMVLFGLSGVLGADQPRSVRTDAPLRPGLIAEYRPLAGKETRPVLVRLDAKPAFTWGDSSPHPRLPPGPFEVIWTGILDLREADPIRFGASVSGAILLSVDGTTLLEGRGRDLNAVVRADRLFARPAGRYRIRIRYRALAGIPARVQIWWESKRFARELLPATHLKHLPGELPAEAREEELAERGREAAARLGCARCHAAAFPAATDPPPGPALTDLGQRVQTGWLVEWLGDPAKIRPGSHMPALFGTDRHGLVERTLVADYLHALTSKGKKPPETKPGDLRAGRQAFLGLGCLACHDDPEKPTRDPARHPLIRLGERMSAAHLAAFLSDPATRYPDGRMPRLPMPARTARDIADYLLQVTGPLPARVAAAALVEEDIAPVLRRLGVADRKAAGAALVRDKGCARCHTGIGEAAPASVGLRGLGEDTNLGCLARKGTAPRFSLDEGTRRALASYLKKAALEKQASPFAARQAKLRHHGCQRCHQRDGDEPAPLEQIARTVWAPFLYRLPFQRTPRLTQATARLRHDHLLSAVRDGVSGVRPNWYSYRMPAFGSHAEEIVRALAEGDGDLPSRKDPPPAASPDPTLTALGPVLVGFEGYSCVSCHLWGGKSLAAVEPGTVGPEMTSLTRRIRRDWFDRFLEDPARLHPGTPMPAIFPRGQPASLKSVLAGEVARQKDAIWTYLAQGSRAASPKPKPPIPITVGKDPLVAQIPLHLPDLSLMESISVVYHSHDALVIDLARGVLHNVYQGARLLRQANVWRSYHLAGSPILAPFVPGKSDAVTLSGPAGKEPLTSSAFLGYERRRAGVLLRWRWHFRSATIDIEDSIDLHNRPLERRLVRQLVARELPPRSTLEVRQRIAKSAEERVAHLTSTTATATLSFVMPPAQQPEKDKDPALLVKPDEGHLGPFERPGYRALLYPRPKTPLGEDMVMPSALASDPRSGRVFVASMKLGDLFVLRDPHDNGKSARFESYARGLFQDVFGMLHDGKDLHVLHRRNLSRLRDTDGDGRADRCDRIVHVPHAVGNAYDWGYGLVRDRAGRFLYTLAPHASHHLPGSGSLLRLPVEGRGKAEEIAFGFRNPLGWCVGPDGEVFFTDNQGEWVATNKLCHIVPGHFYGYPNHAQRGHARKPLAATAVWVPYAWARSINGVAYDTSGGKFGPFAGQFFLAELMHGGAIVRAHVEKVNGVYQGACFPFWGKGLLGPLTLTFDPRGRLFVGSVTTPGWMGQPDRGALFRIDFTGKTPFEIQSIHVRPQGFRLVFTHPVDEPTARQAGAYQIEHYRYEYTSAYGSPEHDRTQVDIRRVELHRDGRTVDVTTAPLVKGRVYRITAAGVRSVKGEKLVHSTGAYTLNEVPGR